jgi:carboxymethylenebutenolidase
MGQRPLDGRRRILVEVTDLQQYIAEEIATDHADGLFSRREAMRRLALLGLSATAASALIVACGNDRKPAEPTTVPAKSPTPAASSPPGMADAVPTVPITWAGPSGELQGAWAQAPAPLGAVLVIHENKGLNDWVRSVAGRLAGAGYSALAVDLLSSQGGTSAFADPAEATAALGKVDPDLLLAEVRSGLDELSRRLPEAKLAVIGFCFGGGLTWRLLASGEPRIAAAIPFYGPAPDDPDFSGSRQAAVLGFYGALDERVNATRPAAQEALDAAGMAHELVVEPDADHAFFNDSGQRYNPAAAADAWQRVKDWLARHVG